MFSVTLPVPHQNYRISHFTRFAHEESKQIEASRKKVPPMNISNPNSHILPAVNNLICAARVTFEDSRKIYRICGVPYTYLYLYPSQQLLTHHIDVWWWLKWGEYCASVHRRWLDECEIQYCNVIKHVRRERARDILARSVHNPWHDSLESFFGVWTLVYVS